MKADGGWTPEQRQAAIDAAHDYIVVRNSLNDPSYAPYCLRCPGFHRMRQVGLLHWRHMCGAEHDEAESRAALAKARGESATGGME